MNNHQHQAPYESMMDNTIGLPGIEESKLDGAADKSDFLQGLGIMKNHSQTMVTSGRP